MPQVNFSTNVFLEKEELIKFQTLLQNDVKSFLVKNDTYSYGIVTQSALSGNDFLVQAGSTSGTFKIANNCYAVDTDLLLLALSAFDNYPVPNDSAWYWVKIHQRYLNTEVGTVSINTQGQLSGVGTKFTSVLRSQTSKAPVKIVFYKEDSTGTPQTVNNAGVYEITTLTDDLNAVLSGSFVADSNLKYIVVGSISLGSTITSGQLAGLYSYDNCLVSLLPETTLNIAPTAGYTVGKDFYIARVSNTGGTLTIQDKREDYFISSSAKNLDSQLTTKINYSTSEIVKSITNNTPTILEGCVGSISGINGALSLTSGSIYWNGEIFNVNSQSVPNFGTNDNGYYYFTVDTVVSINNIRSLILNVGASVPIGTLQFGSFDYTTLFTNLLSLSSYILNPNNNLSDLQNLTAALSNLGVYSKSQTDTNLKAKTNFSTAEICKSIVGVSGAAILEGCVGSLSGIQGALSLTAGSVYWNGEIFNVTAQSIPASSGNTGDYYFTIDPSTITANIRSLILNLGTSVPGGALSYGTFSYAILNMSLVLLSSYILTPDNNLSDLANKATARTNLDVYSKEAADAKYAIPTDMGDVFPPHFTLSDLTGAYIDCSSLIPNTAKMVLLRVMAYSTDVSSIPIAHFRKHGNTYNNNAGGITCIINNTYSFLDMWIPVSSNGYIDYILSNGTHFNVLNITVGAWM